MGFISSILGIGGGVVHVPMMVFLLGFPPLVAVATSTFVLMVSAAIGVVGHALLAHIVWAPAVAVGCGAIVGAQLGARLARKSKPRLIVILLSCVMVALGRLSGADFRSDQGQTTSVPHVFSTPGPAPGASLQGLCLLRRSPKFRTPRVRMVCIRTAHLLHYPDKFTRV